MKRKLTVLFCVLALVMTGAPRCLAYTTDPGAIAADALLARPACLVATILGGAIFVISLPVAATSKSVHRAAYSLMAKPAAMTFTRPLGDFESMDPVE
jgi:hypothetical protein